MGLLYGLPGRLTAKNGGFQPGQSEDCKSRQDWAWQDRGCKLQLQIDDDEMVNIVHEQIGEQVDQTWYNPGNILQDFQLDSNNKWFVTWDSDAAPNTANNCGGSADCVLSVTDSQTSCLCDVAVVDTAVFADAANVPSRAAVLAQLRVGAASPDMFDAGAYTLCTSAACAASDLDEVWTTAGGQFDAETIFKVTDDQGRVRLFANTQSTVQFDGFSFRNPPHMVKTHKTHLDADAKAEIEAMIDHIFHHSNGPGRLGAFKCP